MLSIYSGVFVFTILNIFRYLIKQGRYRNWLITVFYAFSVIVLVTRMLFYICLIIFSFEVAPYIESKKSATKILLDTS